MPDTPKRKRSQAETPAAGPLTAQDESGRCAGCGLLYVRGSATDENYHQTFHDLRVNGPKSKLADGFHVVTHKASLFLQRHAQAAAIAARRETGYDFPSFVASKEADRSRTIAIIYVWNGRVIALVVSREHTCEYQTPLSSFAPGVDSPCRSAEALRIEPHSRRAIEMMWVLKGKRRKGIARRLIDALAEQCSLRIEDFAHMTPLSEDAAAFWRSCGLSMIHVV